MVAQTTQNMQEIGKSRVGRRKMSVDINLLRRAFEEAGTYRRAVNLVTEWSGRRISHMTIWRRLRNHTDSA